MTNEVRELEQQLEVAAEFCRQYQIENKQLVIENNHLQFLLDSVMLEHCPDEMTEEQIENWKKAQRVVDTAHPAYYKSDTYKNNVKFSVNMIK